jgi:hypothetical protein
MRPASDITQWRVGGSCEGPITTRRSRQKYHIRSDESGEESGHSQAKDLGVSSVREVEISAALLKDHDVRTRSAAAEDHDVRTWLPRYSRPTQAEVNLNERSVWQIYELSKPVMAEAGDSQPSPQSALHRFTVTRRVAGL